LQIQADILGIDVVKPQYTESTALGAAFAAGLAVNMWQSELDLPKCKSREYSSQIKDSERQTRLKEWKKAVQRTFHWIE